MSTVSTVSLPVAQSSFPVAMMNGVTFAAQVYGPIATFAEFAAKGLPVQQNPVLRNIAIVFARTMQSALLAASLIGMSVTSFSVLGLLVSVGIGTTMVVTPSVNRFIQMLPNGTNPNMPVTKRVMANLDEVVNISVKVLNTAILTAIIFASYGTPAGVVAGMGLSALSAVTYFKS